MKNSYLITILLLLSNFVFAQPFKKAIEKNGKILISLNSGKSIEIKSKGPMHLLDYSAKHHLIIFSRTEQLSKTKDQEGVPSIDQISVYSYNSISKTETKLFTGCLDGEGGTFPSYGESTEFPFKSLCNIDKVKISQDGSMMYFQTDAWKVCPAVHAYHFKDKTLSFFHAGWLEKVSMSGIEITITGIETKEVNGKKESSGRYTQLCLFNKHGVLLKPLQEKEF
ncbi:MAG: hypothetical protein ACOVP1_01715 [Bacteroidia bacterium]